MALAAPDAPPVVRREARAMGSPLRFQVAGAAAPSLVDAAWTAITDEFEAAEQVLSRFRETSEIHRLRLAGGRVDRPSRQLVAALVAADRARRVTEGRFDPRVLVDLERLGSRPIAVPSAEASVGRTVRPDPAMPILRRSGRHGPIDLAMPVDFGGIGKGLALRWAARRAAAVLDHQPFLLEAGGDIVGHGTPALGAPALGQPPTSEGWRVGIEDPRETTSPDGGSGPLAVLELPHQGGALATSSVRRARWQATDGRAVHHLIDPRTGEPGGTGLVAVTVSAPDPAWAEVWSKSLFLEGRGGIGALARGRGLAAWWVTVDGDVEMTPSGRLMTVWLAGEA